MRPKNPLLHFHHAAESAGYPALLIASGVCLALVVVPIGLLALTRSAWVLAVTLLSLIGAIALLAGVIAASLEDHDEPARGIGDAVGGEHEAVVQSEGRGITADGHVDDRRAA
jgi:hypothetical protein